MAAENSKKLTSTDMNRLVVPQQWLKMLPPLEEWIDVVGNGNGNGNDNDRGKEVTMKVMCLFGYTWEFRCYIRSGPYNKPTLQALEWTKFVNYVGLLQGDKIALRKEHNPNRGTDYFITAQREDATAGRWADLEWPKRPDPVFHHHLF